MAEHMEMDHSTVRNLLPDRDANAHKGNFGKVLLLCGSRGYTGAAYLAAMGALRCGSGLVYLGVPESIYTIEAVKLNEAVVFPLPDQNGMLREAAIGEILERLTGMDAVLIGCGLGRSKDTQSVVKAVLSHSRVPVVVDADGINLLREHRDILRGRAAPTILTPHAGEYMQFAGAVNPDELARELGCILLLKGHRTRITDGTTCYINTTGNPGMAVGGSGDLLAGMIVSLIGQGIAPLEATAMAAWIHGAAGDLCAEKLGQYAMLPTDMLEVLPRLLK